MVPGAMTTNHSVYCMCSDFHLPELLITVSYTHLDVYKRQFPDR